MLKIDQLKKVTGNGQKHFKVSLLKENIRRSEDV